MGLKSKTRGVLPLVSLSHFRKLASLKSHTHATEILSNIDSYYKPFYRHDKGKKRKIDNPIGDLKKSQTSILKNILQTIDLPDNIEGGVKGCSPKTNASKHLNQQEMVQLDIRDCYPSTSHRQVYKVFRQDLGCSTNVSHMLTRLTTYKGYLPQGAPTSSYILILCTMPLFLEINEICEKNNLILSSYVDDYAVSGNNPQRHIGSIVKVIQKYGYAVSHRKIKISQKNHIITGVAVNNTLSVPKDKIKKYEECIETLNLDPKNRKLINQVRGQINSTYYINEEQGEKLENLIR